METADLYVQTRVILLVGHLLHYGHDLLFLARRSMFGHKH